MTYLGNWTSVFGSIVELLAQVGESNLSSAILRFLDNWELFTAQTCAIQDFILKVNHFLESFPENSWNSVKKVAQIKFNLLRENVGVLVVFQIIVDLLGLDNHRDGSRVARIAEHLLCHLLILQGLVPRWCPNNLFIFKLVLGIHIRIQLIFNFFWIVF